VLGIEAVVKWPELVVMYLFWALMVIRAGVPEGGQVPSAARDTLQSPPCNAFFTASKRRKVAQLMKFPSQSVIAQAASSEAFVVTVSPKRLSVTS
jgi:hypothetical protein